MLYEVITHFGNHEQFVYPNGTRKDLFYIFGGKDLAAVYKRSSVGSTQSSEIGYVLKDHLGSVWALANESGGFRITSYNVCYTKLLRVARIRILF